MSNRFLPVNSSGGLQAVTNQMNRNFAKIDNESITKVFNGPAGHSIVQGRLPNGKYGQLNYDNDGVPVILLGQAPDDGRPGLWITPEGTDVLGLLEA